MAGELMLINPRRRRRRTTSRRRRVTHARRNPIRRRRRSHRRVTRVRRNPVGIRHIYRRARSRSSGLGGFFSNTLVPSSVGAIGALGVDFLIANVPLPAGLTTGAMAPVARIAGAVGVGYLARSLGGKSFGNQAMSGAIVVTLYDMLKGWMQGAVPGVSLGYPGVAYQMPDNMLSGYAGDEAFDGSYGMGAAADDLVYSGFE